MSGESCKLVLLKDSLTYNAKYLIPYLIANTTDHLYILCLEKSPEKWISFLSTDVRNCHTSVDTEDFTNTIGNMPSVILIDSFNQLAALHGWEKSLLYIDRLRKRNNVNNVIVIMHKDCLVYGEKMIKESEHICNVLIDLLSIESANKFVVNMRRMLSGKIKNTMSYIYYDLCDGKWKDTEIETNPSSKFDKSNNASKTSDSLIDNISSFKIAVEKSAELESKNNLILPYTELTKEGSLTYNDDIDDWDDEDPDDDLNI